MTIPGSGIPGLEKREHYRARFVAAVEIESSGSRYPGRTADISLGGVLLELDRKTPVEPGVEFLLRLPLGEETLLELPCVVRQVTPGVGIGAEFLDLRPAERVRLRRLIETLPH